MQISAATDTIPSLPVEPKASAPPDPGAAASTQDSVSLHREAELLAMLEQPPIRPEVVARGQALVADRNYPPPEVINDLAKLIAGGSA